MSKKRTIKDRVARAIRGEIQPDWASMDDAELRAALAEFNRRQAKPPQALLSAMRSSGTPESACLRAPSWRPGSSARDGRAATTTTTR